MPDEKDISRRRFLQYTGLVTGAAAALGLSTVSVAAEQGGSSHSGHAAAASNPLNRARMFFTNELDFSTLSDAAERIFPKDELGPGAKELAVPYFIDNQLAGAYGYNAREYIAGPHFKGAPTQGYQTPLVRRDLFRQGILAQGRKIFGNRHKLAAVRAQAIKDFGQGFYGLLMGIMEQENAAQLLPADERLHILDARPLRPVHAVDGPQHDVRPFGLGYRHSIGIKISVRRPDVARMHAEFPQRFLNAQDFTPLHIGGKMAERLMRIGMVADFMPFLLEAHDELRVVFDLPAHDKEGGVDAPLPQDLHQAPGMPAGAVVKRQRAKIAPLAHFQDGAPVHHRPRAIGGSVFREQQGPCAQQRGRTDTEQSDENHDAASEKRQALLVKKVIR